MRWLRNPVTAALLMGASVGLTVLGAYGLGRDSRPVPPPVVHIAPPQCEGAAGGFCFIDLPDCVEYVTLLDPVTGVMTWYRQDWCTGETAAD